MSRQVPSRQAMRLFVWFALTASVGCGTTPDDLLDSSDDLSMELIVEPNPLNPFAADVLATIDDARDIFVEYGEGGLFDRRTPTVSLAADTETKIQVLGLHADREYRLRLVTDDGDTRQTSKEFSHRTAELPPNWPDCSATFHEPQENFSDTEVICTNGYLPDEYEHLVCIDRSGQPVWFLAHPNFDPIWQIEVLSDGVWGALAQNSGEMLFFDIGGELLERGSMLAFEGKTRFEHDWINEHELIEIVEGPWSGAIAVLTTATEWIDHGEGLVEYHGNGIIVFDRASKDVLWDWSVHGELGDAEPIDPSIAYEREVLLDGAIDWLHGNALVHVVEEDGQQYFWMSLREQDWIINIDVQTDEVVWRLGYEGDFTLVDDLDSSTPQTLDPDLWMYHQHSPQFVSRTGSRTRMLVFDNGAIRASAADVPDWDDEYSRVVEFEFDEDTMYATVRFEHGDSDPESAEHFYSFGVGDVDISRDGQSLFFNSGWDDPGFIAEITYPDGEERWRFACEAYQPYRILVFPSIYETTDGYDR